ncbi:MAG TPA: CHASE2 domain-containing protein [Stellaceae bacterium]|nr:CHASE2 domain-containing protein [Stellaceae bacterium]
MGRSIALLRGPGRAAALALVAAALVLRIIDPGIITELRVRSFDLVERVWPRAGDSARVAIVDIDEKSLARYGQWPWPWHRVAELVRRIAQGNPRVLGIDVVFAEPDRLSPTEIARELPGLPPAVTDALAQLPPSERDLAEAMAAVPTVLALAPSHEEAAPDSDPLRPAPLRQAGGDPKPFLKSYKSLVQSQPDLRAVAQAAGEIAVEPDSDGVVRRLALAVAYQQTIVPSFALEVLRVAGGERSIVIDTGALGIEDFRIGGTTIPTDRRGRAILHFAPSQARSISASDVLDPAFDPAELRGQLVLLGVAGVGITGLRQTPLGLVRAVDLHAELIESILFNALLHRPSYLDWFELAAALAAGLVVIWLLRYARPLRAVGIAVAITAALFGAELMLFRFADLLFDSTFPALTLSCALGAMLVGNLRATQVELVREREAKQRVEGELAAAQVIQMGLLPRRFPAFPDRHDIDVYARIEPARMVGGDLYDYLLIGGSSRLFFLIADVAGKGIAAALLMAVTKEVVRDAVLTFGPALDRILAEANRKTAAASAELQNEGGVFVTAFAGILDLGSGEVAYASAGHDSPFVLGGAAGLRQLVTEGGPPLGAVEDFRFPIDHDRIELGEVLLLFTDGVTEAENADHKLYSSERLAKALATAATVDAQHVVAAVIDDVSRFVGDAEQADDMTVLALRRVGAAATGP